MKNKVEGAPQDPLLGVYDRIIKNIEEGNNFFSGLNIVGNSVYHHILKNAMNNMNILPFMKAAKSSKESIAEAEATMKRNLELIKRLEELPEDIKQDLRESTDPHKIAQKYAGDPEIISVEPLIDTLSSFAGRRDEGAGI